MTSPDKGESPFLALARQLAGASSDEEAASIFNRATGLTGDPEADEQELARRATVRARGGARWDCEAYGPAATEHLGPLCFFALNEPCRAETECKTRLVGERQRLFDRMTELAGGNHPNAEAYRVALDGFTSPDQLLGGPGDRSPE